MDIMDIMIKTITTQLVITIILKESNTSQNQAFYFVLFYHRLIYPRHRFITFFCNRTSIAGKLSYVDISFNIDLVYCTVYIIYIIYTYSHSVLGIWYLFSNGSQLSALVPSKKGLAPGGHCNKFLLLAPAPNYPKKRPSSRLLEAVLRNFKEFIIGLSTPASAPCNFA